MPISHDMLIVMKGAPAKLKSELIMMLSFCQGIGLHTDQAKNTAIISSPPERMRKKSCEFNIIDNNLPRTIHTRTVLLNL